MRPANNLFFVILLLCVLTPLSGCQGRSLSEVLWPDQHDAFFQLTKTWSRSGVVRDGLEKETRVVALLKSETWRKGYVQRYSELFGLTQDETQKMLADQLLAATEETVFILAIGSTYPDDARMTHRLTQWRVLLREDPDLTVSPLEIRPMEVHQSQLQAFFPHYHPWQRYYTIRFPKSQAPLELLFTGPAGQFTMTWDKSE